MLPLVSFYYLRHGETEWNRIGRCQGKSDIPLNETGRGQAEQARGALKDVVISTICCSPLKRARETADIVNRSLNLPVVEVDELMEIGFGVHEGDRVGAWWSDWFESNIVPEGAEAYENFIARAHRGLVTALGFDGPVLIVAHGGVYWAVQHALAIAENRVIPNAKPVYHIPPVKKDADWRIEGVGENLSPETWVTRSQFRKG